MNEQQRRNVILAGGAVALVLLGVLIGLVISLIGVARQPVAREIRPADSVQPAAALSPEQQAEARYREFALKFYTDFHLRHDMSAGWDMMKPELAKRRDSAGKEKYIQDFSDRGPDPIPADLSIKTFPDRRDTAATVLFQTSEHDPYVVLVQEVDGRLWVVESWYWKGEKLP